MNDRVGAVLSAGIGAPRINALSPGPVLIAVCCGFLAG